MTRMHIKQERHAAFDGAPGTRWLLDQNEDERTDKRQRYADNAAMELARREARQRATGEEVAAFLLSLFWNVR